MDTPSWSLPSLCITKQELRNEKKYAEYKASVNIQTLELMDGKLSRRAQELVLDWAELHQKELLEDWELCRQHQEPKKIEPLN